MLISDQVFELAAWQHEPRGRGGKWVKEAPHSIAEAMGIPRTEHLAFQFGQAAGRGKSKLPVKGDIAFMERPGRSRLVGRVVARAGLVAGIDADDGNRYHVDVRNGKILKKIPLSQVGPALLPLKLGEPQPALRQRPVKDTKFWHAMGFRTPEPSPPGDIVAPGVKQLQLPGMEEITTPYGYNSKDAKRLRALMPQVNAILDAYREGRPLPKGAKIHTPHQGIQGQTSIITLPGGTKVISKTQDTTRQDREELAYYVSQAINGGLPAVARDPADPRHMIQDYVDGQMAERYAQEQAGEGGDWGPDYSPEMIEDEITSGSNSNIGLLDYLTSNPDRHDQNWMVDRQGNPTPIDMGSARFDDSGTGSPFWDGEYIDPDPDWAKQTLEDLAPLQGEFSRLGHPEWFANMMEAAAGLGGDMLPPDDYRRLLVGQKVTKFSSIADQVLELSWKNAWLHERRDAHGRWTRGGGMGLSSDPREALIQEIINERQNTLDDGVGAEIVKASQYLELKRYDAAASALDRAAKKAEATGEIPDRYRELAAKVRKLANGTEDYPGQHGEQIVSYWKTETDHDAKQNLNLAGASYDADDYLGAAEYLRRAEMTAGDLVDQDRYDKLANNIEFDAMNGDPIGSLAKRLDALVNIDGIDNGIAHRQDIIDNISHAARLFEAAPNSADKGYIAGALHNAAGYVGKAASLAPDGSALNTELEHLEHLVRTTSPSAVTSTGGGLRTQMQDFVRAQAGKIPGMLGGEADSHEDWNGQIGIEPQLSTPYTLGELGWDRTMKLREDVAKSLATSMSMTGEPISDPGAFSVPFHELIHGVTQKGTSFSSDQSAYQDPANATIEEGFTELGTVQHMPDWLEAAGVSDRPTEILSSIDGSPVPNPDWEHGREALHNALRDEAARVRVAGSHHSQAVWDDAARHVDAAADDIDNGQINDALDELDRLQHLGDKTAADNALKLKRAIQVFADIPQDKHATMGEYARRLQETSRVAEGNAWGHYPDQTRAAQEWVLQVAQAEAHAAGRGFDARGPASPDWKRVVELTDEINRVGTAGKLDVMASQIARLTRKGSPVSYGEGWDSLRENIRDGFQLGSPSGKDAFRNAMAALRGQGLAAQGLFAKMRSATGNFMTDTYGIGIKPPAEVQQFTEKAAAAVPGLLGGGHETFNGQVELHGNLDEPGITSVRAMMGWDGTMKMRKDVAQQLEELVTTSGKVNPDAAETVLHELIHGDIPEGQDYQDQAQAYQDMTTGLVEESFTEMGAIMHAPEFFDRMGIGSRPADNATPVTVRQLADMRNKPPNQGGGWGHYDEVVQRAWSWIAEVSAAEGRPGDKAHIQELADEVNRQGASGKMGIMVAQVVRAAARSNPQKWGGLRLSRAALDSIRAEIAGVFTPEGDVKTAFASATRQAMARMAEQAAQAA